MEKQLIRIKVKRCKVKFIHKCKLKRLKGEIGENIVGSFWFIIFSLLIY